MRIKLTTDRVRELLRADPLQLPQYTSQLINLANQNAQGTRPRVVGQMSDLVQEFDGRTIKEWEAWYLGQYSDRIEIASDRIWVMVEKLKSAIQVIDRDMVNLWVRDLILVKTFVGLRFQEAILAEVAGRLNQQFRLAEPDEESQGIDGFIGELSVSIKPISYQAKGMLSETIQVSTIYYEKKDNDLFIEYDENSIT
jgi:hypothetical protein